MRIIMIAAVAGLGGLALSPHPVEAQTAVPNVLAQVEAGNAPTSYAQWRRGGYYAGPRGYYAPRYYAGRPYYYRRDRGSAAAAGIAGLAAGALIGGAIASQQAQAAPTYVGPDQNAVAYCAQRYRSYDPASGTYVGYDGVRRSCP
jgi:BA14K-like protein